LPPRPKSRNRLPLNGLRRPRARRSRRRNRLADPLISRITSSRPRPRASQCQGKSSRRDLPTALR
jgi:hypothetical protein